METATHLTPTGEVEALSPSDWLRKRFCEYDTIRRELTLRDGIERISDTEWAESQRQCREAREADAPDLGAPAGETETRAAASPKIQ